MKVFFIISTTLTVSLVYFFKFKKKPASYRDKFRVEFLLIPAGILAFFVNHEFSVMEIFWTFSIYLEAVAILPQLFMGKNWHKTNIMLVEIQLDIVRLTLVAMTNLTLIVRGF